MESVKKKASSFLLDTHALLWWLFDDPRLSRPAYDIIQEPDNMHMVLQFGVIAANVNTIHNIQ